MHLVSILNIAVTSTSKPARWPFCHLFIHHIQQCPGSRSRVFQDVHADVAFFSAPFPLFLSATPCSRCSSYSSTRFNPENSDASGHWQLVRVVFNHLINIRTLSTLTGIRWSHHTWGEAVVMETSLGRTTRRRSRSSMLTNWELLRQLGRYNRRGTMGRHRSEKLPILLRRKLDIE